MRPIYRLPIALIAASILIYSGRPLAAGDGNDVLRPDNLVAWCIVPFDAKDRGPAERAAMLKELDVSHCAYDWRREHVPTFEDEILQYREHGIEFFAFWSEHPRAFELFEKYDLHPQIWKTAPSPAGDSDEARVEAAVKSLTPLVTRAGELGSKFGLYNHGGWGGEPANLVAVCRRFRELGHEHVGIVYNFHHAHGHIEDWPEVFAAMKPYLLCLNLNGMNEGAKPKIVPIGQGRHEAEMIRVVVESDYDGPIGVLDHRSEIDAREALKQNLEGLAELRKKFAKDDKPQEDRDVSATEPKSAEGEFPYDPQLISALINEASKEGDAKRGAAVFASAKTACLSCHRVGAHGGKVGPELSKIAAEKKLPHIVESIFWPKREVKPEYVVHQVLTIDGRIRSGFRHAEDDDHFTLRDANTGKLTAIPQDEIDDVFTGSTPMPAALAKAMSRRQQVDLIRFLSELGRGEDGTVTDGVPPEIDSLLARLGSHAPADFPLSKAPLEPAHWPNASHRVNRDRIYDFYTKQAEHFRRSGPPPMLLKAYPGLDGADTGHWGNQTESTWRDDRWNKMRLGSVQAGVLNLDGRRIARAICLRLGDHAVCFNPDTHTYEAFWKGGFVSYSSTRRGFLGGMKVDGKLLSLPAFKPRPQPVEYLGFHRAGNEVAFHFRAEGSEYLEIPRVVAGKLTRTIVPFEDHPFQSLLTGSDPTSPKVYETEIALGDGSPYAIDTITVPEQTEDNSLFFFGGHDFLPDGSAMLCTMQGDVWHVSGLDSGTARWRRFASGLHHPQGLVVDEDGAVFVQCRDALMRLTDEDGDGSADYYECFDKSFKTSPAGHDFICGLERDADGNFYTSSGNQGLLRIGADGESSEVIATGFRNPDGLGLLPDGTISVPASEGSWTPASMICAVTPKEIQSGGRPHFGYRGPRGGKPPSLPLAYLPRALDNSSGGQVFVDGDRWGPLSDQLLHLSFGMGSWFTVLRDEVDGVPQGAVVPMTGDFLSGVHRGRFRPQDGQLYVTGMQGWGSYTIADGCFQRVRYTGAKFQTPIGFHVHENGVRVEFAEPVAAEVATEPKSHFAQSWNYRYSGGYGSPEYSPSHPGVAGHDPLEIASAHVLDNGTSLFVEIPEIQPVSQLHLRLNVNRAGEVPTANPAGTGHDLFVTVHRLDAPFTGFPGYVERDKLIAVHPLLSDMRLNAARKPNPWRNEVKGAQPIRVLTGENLSYQTRELTVTAGEPIAFTLANPDVVPHNWVLAKRGTLRSVGELANKLIADPDAFARHYVPKTADVLVHTDVVGPGDEQTIYFKAPEEPGRYPFLCTFPGHWMVMNGTMVVGVVDE
ncbi:plastocyanin/azurin family copper-binding protein [Stratiformator vulcanicus]|uniref:Auracyanin-A n=1 Tax=Stratiformator vulcanicus TaxID=2527980 RepID=A0A517QVV4_9PLAN|nr:plastocyanin/azurin family copper-binding protein [Stratiformator vulcanicus]QDT35697.1 Auracyanin-A precursor [Stratiformator vulcanicus]